MNALGHPSGRVTPADVSGVVRALWTPKMVDDLLAANRAARADATDAILEARRLRADRQANRAHFDDLVHEMRTMLAPPRDASY